MISNNKMIILNDLSSCVSGIFWKFGIGWNSLVLLEIIDVDLTEHNYIENNNETHCNWKLLLSFKHLLENIKIFRSDIQ